MYRDEEQRGYKRIGRARYLKEERETSATASVQKSNHKATKQIKGGCVMVKKSEDKEAGSTITVESEEMTIRSQSGRARHRRAHVRLGAAWATRADWSGSSCRSTWLHSRSRARRRRRHDVGCPTWLETSPASEAGAFRRGTSEATARVA